MARAALNWSIKELAAKANVSPITVSRFERQEAAAIPATISAMRGALEAAGIRFIDWGVKPPEHGGSAHDRAPGAAGSI